MKKGHPWITLDEYSKRFPRDNTFLIGVDGKEEECCLIIHDPEHKTVKARVWSTELPFLPQVKDFNYFLNGRLMEAFKKRRDEKVHEERENFYVVFGEADSIPGLNILVLKNQLILQYYAHYWNRIEPMLLECLVMSIKQAYPELGTLCVWVQDRNTTQTKSFKNVPLPQTKNGRRETEIVLSEYDINYKISLDMNYDLGIYTDMANIRKKMFPMFDQADSVLNLFAYTGAFSLTALKRGAKEVVSVDLSDKYLEWLEENIDLNTDLDKSLHTSMNMPVEKALSQFIKEEKKFDFVICDPPSASSDGKRTTSAFKKYETLLPQLLQTVKPGGNLLVILNTHKINWNKFSDHIKEIIDKSPYKKEVIFGKRFKMTDDCPTLHAFREGDYIKGLLIEFKDNK